MNIATSDLSLEQKSHLVSGVGPWYTFGIPELGVGQVILSDGPHGLRYQGAGGENFGLTESAKSTCFPPAVAIGSSWDPSVAERVAAAIGREARSLGVNIVLGPGVNIKRSPLCGRNFEYFSEDPLLAGVIGAAFVSAIQAEGVGCSVKHFAANNQEHDRMRVSSDVDERTLREIYFPAFERIVKESRPATLMCSYNRINGVFASENRWLLTDVLRGEWGFDGVVMSDWGAVHDNAAAVTAGLDLEMPGTDGRTPPLVAEAVRNGTLDEADLDVSVARILGLQAWRTEPSQVEIDVDAQHQLAREVAAQCAVLLKNDGTLPLAGTTKLAVIGEFARTPRFQGGGSSHVAVTRSESFLDALPEFSDGVAFAPGFDLDGSGDESALRDAAVELAAGAEVAVIFAGLGESDESEGFDRTSIELPRAQVELIRAVAAAAPRTVVVLSNGGVVSVEQWHDDVAAILEGFLLGQASGGAIADVLFGKVNPSGRLAETIPRRLTDHPSTQNFPGERGHVVYGERLLVGYRALTTLATPARYPFGYGLSYTTFELSDFTVDVTGADSAVAGVKVTNTGPREGAHVVQIYVDATSNSDIQRPARELRAFAKVTLEAGQSRVVSLPLDRRAFAFWDTDASDWVVEAGSYIVQLGRDSEAIVAEQTISLAGDGIVRELTLWSTLEEWLTHPVVGPVMLDEIDSDKLRYVAQPHILRGIGTLPMRKIADSLRDTVAPETFEALMARTRRDEGVAP